MGSRIYDGNYWVIEHAYPVRLKGWLVIVLKRHAEALHELTKEEFEELAALQEKVTKTLFAVLGVEKEYSLCLAEGNYFHHIHFHQIGIPKNLPDKYKGPKVFGLMHEKPIAEKEIIAFCRKLQKIIAENIVSNK